MTHRFFLEKKNKLLICFHSFISSVIQKSYDFTNFILKIDVMIALTPLKPKKRKSN